MCKFSTRDQLRPSIGICLLDATEFQNEAAVQHSFQLRSEDGLLLTDCLQIVLIELPKYVPLSDNRVISDPVEQWLYFFCRAGASAPDELVGRLPDRVFAEATGVLERIAKNPNERRLYNERLKMERDERARNLQAREEGRQEGIEEGLRRGAMVGRIQLLQQLSGLASQSADELAGLGLDALAALESELQGRLRERS